MKKLVLSLLAVVSLVSLAFANDGNWYYERYWTGYGWGYRKTYYPQQQVYQPVIKKDQTTTVVNNLIGIPVPVQYTQPIAQQGTTVYGYSSLAETYGNVDLGLLYNQAARLTDQAQQLAGQASADFQSLVQAEGSNRAEVAKIVAQGQAAREALLAAKGPATQALQRGFSFKVVQDSRGEMKVERLETTGPDFNLATPQALRSNISDVLRNRCLECHGDKKTSGGLNFLQSITDAQQALVLDRITSLDPAKRMPPPARGVLSVQEYSAFFEAMSPKTAAK